MLDDHPSFVDLFDKHGTVDVLRIDGEFEKHQTDPQHEYEKHDVKGYEVLELHKDNGAFLPNEGEDRRAPIIMVGETREGRMIAVPIEPTTTYGEWRAVTAFEANAWAVEEFGKRRI